MEVWRNGLSGTDEINEKNNKPDYKHNFSDVMYCRMTGKKPDKNEQEATTKEGKIW